MNIGEKPNFLKNIKRTIAVHSCKGGVGKSTIAINLAFALQLLGHEVGILDADLYGPSLPVLLKFDQNQTLKINEEIPEIFKPFAYKGV